MFRSGSQRWTVVIVESVLSENQSSALFHITLNPAVPLESLVLDKRLVGMHAELLRDRIRDVRDANRKGEAVLLFQLYFQIGNVVLEVSLLELGIQFLLITAQEEKLHLLIDVARKQFGVISAQTLKNLVKRNELEPDLALSGNVPPAATGLLDSSLHPPLGVDVELLNHPEASLALSEAVLGSRLVRFGARLKVAAVVLSLLVRAFQVVKRVQFGRAFVGAASEGLGLGKHLVDADPNSSFSQFLYEFGVHLDCHRFRVPAQSPVHDTLDQSRAVGTEALDLLEEHHLLLVL